MRAKVQSILVAFQFQDRVSQGLNQVCDSITNGAAYLQQALESGGAPDPHAWDALLHAGYTSAEQTEIAEGKRAPSQVVQQSDTIIF